MSDYYYIDMTFDFFSCVIRSYNIHNGDYNWLLLLCFFLTT